MRKMFSCLWVVVIICTVACTPKADYSSKISALDSLQVELGRAETAFMTIDVEATQALFSGVDKDMEMVQSSFQGDMSKNIAKELSDYRGVSKIVKDFPRRYSRINAEIERTKTQLSGLKQALADGATIDGQGNEITPEYVERMFSQEEKVASSLISEIDELCLKLKQAQERYDNTFPGVQPFLDSLRVNTPQ